MKLLSRFIFAGILGGLSLGMAVGLLASSAWLISMASTQPPILTLQVAVVSVRFFGLSRGVFRYAERIYGHDAILRVATKLQISIYEALVKREPINSAALQRGKLLQQITTDIEVVQDRWIRIFIPGLSAAISAWAGVGIISWLAPSISLVVLGIYLIVLALIILITTRSSRLHSSQIFETETAMANLISDNVRGHLEAKIYGYQRSLEKLLNDSERTIIAAERRLISDAGASNSLLLAGMYGSVVASFVMGLNLLENKELAGINLAVVTLLPLVIFEGLGTLITPLSNYGKILSAEKNINSVLNSSRIANTPATLEPGPIVLEVISARSIWQNQVLGHVPINFTLKNGESLLLQGESGIGKSSLAYAFAGLIDYEGSIRLNGIEVRNLQVMSLREAMTVSLQDDHLFASSILENLRLANPDASTTEIETALGAVELDQLIDELPDGLDTHIGAFGKNFSGGELQRIRLARIFLRKTPLYILDEPLEHLNQDLAKRIFQRLQEHMSGATVVVISHEKIPGVTNSMEIFTASSGA